MKVNATDTATREIIGVVPDVSLDGMFKPVLPTIYFVDIRALGFVNAKLAAGSGVLTVINHALLVSRARPVAAFGTSPERWLNLPSRYELTRAGRVHGRRLRKRVKTHRRAA